MWLCNTLWCVALLIGCMHISVASTLSMHRTNITGRLFYIYIWELPIFVAMAVVCGVAGALFVAVNIRLRRLRRRLMTWDTPRQWWRSAEVRLGDSGFRGLAAVFRNRRRSTAAVGLPGQPCKWAHSLADSCRQDRWAVLIRHCRLSHPWLISSAN